MKENIKAYSKEQFRATGFMFSDYSLIEEEGTFRAVVDSKAYGNRNLTAYFTLEDGRKIFAAAFPERNYLGLTEIPFGASVELTFKKAKTTDRIYLRGVTLCDTPPAA